MDKGGRNMPISFMADNGTNISCAEDAAMYNVFAGSTDIVLAGIGNELAINYNSSSLQVTLSSGEGIICGRHVTVTGSDVTLTLQPNRTGLILALRYDLTQSGSNIVQFANPSELQSDDLNNGGDVHDLFLATVSTDSNGVTSITDKRKIRSAIVPASVETSEHTDAIKYGTTAPTNSLGEDGDIYIQYTA